MARKHLEMKTQKEELQNMIRVGLKYLPANFLDVTCKSRGGVRSGADLRQAHYQTRPAQPMVGLPTVDLNMLPVSLCQYV